ncbi:MAG: hypothetical protein BRC31_08870 [Actinobacteria bacterium QS_5_72_10]|nr:MAG: hypothetical protein BRC31_08870 [Actinobacteria bacterium QS_5_72_10]
MTAGLPWGGVVVLGAGTSGAAATRALLTAGVAPVWVVDSRDTPALRATADELRAAGADVALGVTDPAAVTGAALVVTSPGLSLAHPLLAAALAASAPVISEPELAWRLNAGHTRWVAITGTNGKTTTTQLAAACLNAPAIGNIGPPLCDALAVAEPTTSTGTRTWPTTRPPRRGCGPTSSARTPPWSTSTIPAPIGWPATIPPAPASCR